MLDKPVATQSPWYRARARAGEPVLRVVTGLLFAQYGAQKLLGVLGGFRGQPGATALDGIRPGRGS